MDDTAPQLTLQVTSTQALVHCPVCRFPTRRVHRRSVRTVAELPWGPGHVVLSLPGRKCFCAKGRCPRRLVTARLAPLVAPGARRTRRLVHWLAHVALALGGRAGGRLRWALGLPVSRPALVRLRRRLPVPACPTPRVLGVDDWADKTRQPSGPVLIDRERRRPLALWPDWEAKTCARGLQTPPGVGVSTRDRSKAYADGAPHGAPDASQGADRLHLRPHLADALDQGLNPHGHVLAAVTKALHQASVAHPDGPVTVPVPPPSSPRTVQALAHQRQAPRRALQQPSGAVHQQGWPAWAMAQPLGIGKTTVFRYRHTATVPARKRRAERGRRILTPYHAYRLARWNAGHRDAVRLFRERQQRGDPGSDPTVARYAQRLRQAPGQAPRQRRPRQILPAVAEPGARHLTARRAPWLVLRRPERWNDGAAVFLAPLQAQHPAVAPALALAQDCVPLVRERQPDQLAPWLARAAERPLAPLQRLAQGSRDADEAVKAGITLPWSNGPGEGHINRLKMLKRQLVGRANLDVLQPRFRWAA